MASFSRRIIEKVKGQLQSGEGLTYALAGSYLVFLAIQKKNFPLGLAGSLVLIRGGSLMGKASKILSDDQTD